MNERTKIQTMKMKIRKKKILQKKNLIIFIFSCAFSIVRVNEGKKKL